MLAAGCGVAALFAARLKSTSAEAQRRRDVTAAALCGLARCGGCGAAEQIVSAGAIPPLLELARGEAAPAAPAASNAASNAASSSASSVAASSAASNVASNEAAPKPRYTGSQEAINALHELHKHAPARRAIEFSGGLPPGSEPTPPVVPVLRTPVLRTPPASLPPPADVLDALYAIRSTPARLVAAIAEAERAADAIEQAKADFALAASASASGAASASSASSAAASSAASTSTALANAASTSTALAAVASTSALAGPAPRWSPYIRLVLELKHPALRHITDLAVRTLRGLLYSVLERLLEVAAKGLRDSAPCRLYVGAEHGGMGLDAALVAVLSGVLLVTTREATKKKGEFIDQVAQVKNGELHFSPSYTALVLFGIKDWSPSGTPSQTATLDVDAALGVWHTAADHSRAAPSAAPAPASLVRRALSMLPSFASKSSSAEAALAAPPAVPERRPVGDDVVYFLTKVAKHLCAELCVRAGGASS